MRLDRLPAFHPSSRRYKDGRLNEPVNLKALELTDEPIAAPPEAKSGRTVENPRASAWDNADLSNDPDRPSLSDIRLPEDRRTHILDGDGPGKPGGGHRHGTGRPGKTEFPAEWDDDKIVSMVEDAARSPDRVIRQEFNSRWWTTGKREGVEVTSIVCPDGRIWSAWPEPGGPGVIENPKV